MKKVMLKKPRGKEFLAAGMAIGGIYYGTYYLTNSVALGVTWVAIASLAGALGIVAMKAFGRY